MRKNRITGVSCCNYILSRRLQKLDELDRGGSVRVEVAISAQITNLKTGTTVWTNAVNEQRPWLRREISGRQVTSVWNAHWRAAIGHFRLSTRSFLAKNPRSLRAFKRLPAPQVLACQLP